MKRFLILFLLCSVVCISYADKSHLGLLPEEAESVYSFNVPLSEENDILGEELIKRAESYFGKFMKATGIDMKKEVVWLTIGTVPSDKEKEDVKKKDGSRGTYLIMSGKFDEEAVLENLKNTLGTKDAPGVGTETVLKNYTIYYDTKSETGLCFIKDSLLVTGHRDSVRIMIEAYKHKARSLAKKKEFAAVVPPVGRRTVVWGILLNPEPGEPVNLSNRMVPGAAGRMGGRRRGFGETMIVDTMTPVEEALGEYVSLGFSVDTLGKQNKDGKVSDWSLLQIVQLFPGTKYASETASAINKLKSSSNSMAGWGVPTGGSDPVVKLVQEAELSSRGSILKYTYKSETDEIEDLRDRVVPHILPPEREGRVAAGGEGDMPAQVPPMVRDFLKRSGFSDEEISKAWEETKNLSREERRKKIEELIRKKMQDGGGGDGEKPQEEDKEEVF